MNLPVKALDATIPFYETILRFKILMKQDCPPKIAVLGRDEIQIGLAENGGDPSQDGCFFEVDSVEAAFEELKANGLKKEISDFKLVKHGETSWKVFYVIAPDELCYCIGERQKLT